MRRALAPGWSVPRTDPLSIPLLTVPGPRVPARFATLASFGTLRVPFIRRLLHFTHSPEGREVEVGGGGLGGICIGIQDLQRDCGTSSKGKQTNTMAICHSTGTYHCTFNSRKRDQRKHIQKGRGKTDRHSQKPRVPGLAGLLEQLQQGRTPNAQTHGGLFTRHLTNTHRISILGTSMPAHSEEHPGQGAS